MLITFVVFACLSLVALLVLLWLFLPTTKAATTVPGLNITNDMHGNLNNIAAAGSLSKFLTLLHLEHGPIASFWYGEFLTISLGTSALLKQVRKLFPCGGGVYQSLVPVLGDPWVHTQRGPHGIFLHKVLSRIQPFSFSASANSEKVRGSTKEICGVWSALAEDDQIPALDYMTALALKIVATSQLGPYFKEEVNIASLNKAYNNVMVDLQNKMTDVIHWEENDPREIAFRKKVEVLKQIISKCANNLEEDEGNSLFLEKIRGESDQDSVVATLTSLALTEITTISFLLTWILYYVSIFPEVQNKVRSQPNYMEKVLKEVLRISQFVPFATKIQPERELVLEGHAIEPGTLVMLSSATVLMNPDVYIDPESFNPSRVFPADDPLELLLPGTPSVTSSWSWCVVKEVATQILTTFNVKAADPSIRCGATFCPFAKPDADVWLKINQL